MNILATKQLKKAHPTDAAFDIEASEDDVIFCGDSALISTDLKVAIPNGYCGILKSRSGLSVKHGIDVGAGVIDAGYRGEVKVLLRNHSTEDFAIRVGDRIAQLMIVPVPEIEWIVVSELPEADRGDNGFGSSGVGHV
jgi:dUTP pyrophosphatase